MAGLQMEAERALLAASLAGDPWAARFLLLSESCIPLYPASVVWMQLISQPLSRINACMKPEDPEDYNHRMGYRCAPPPPSAPGAGHRVRPQRAALGPRA